MKKLSDYLNDEGQLVTSITAVRIFGNDTGRHIVDQNGKRITALEKVPLSELASLAREAPIWMGDHGPIDPPLHLIPEYQEMLKVALQKPAPPKL